MIFVEKKLIYLQIHILKEFKKFFHWRYLWISSNATTGIVAESVDYRTKYRTPENVGGIAMKLSLYVHPKNVSFKQIALEEVPWMQGGSVSGYYALPEQATNRYHGTAQEAGKWRNVTNENFWAIDMAGNNQITNWCTGTKTWDIPIGWNVANTAEGASPAKMFGPYQMDFTLSTNGTLRIDKFGHWVSRGASSNPNGPDDGQIFLDGVEKYWWEDIDRWREEDFGGDVIWIY